MIERKPFVGMSVTVAVGLLLMALALPGCPGEKKGTEAVVDGPAKAVDGERSESAAASGGDKGAEEPAPGSREVETIGPPAPTVMVLAGLKGYTEPCGCTLDVLVGGLDRINGYVDGYRALAKGAVVVDAGNTLFDEPQLAPHRVAQERVKADVIVDGLKALDIASTTPGPNDFALGKHFYLDKVRGAGIEILAANVAEEEGLPLGVGHMVQQVGEAKVAFIGVVDPELFAGVEGLTFSDPIEAVKKELAAVKAEHEDVNAVVVVDHGDLAHTKTILEAVPEVHFVIVGHGPRETDAVDEVASGYTLEAYDQGRYVGILQLYPRGQAMPERYANGRQGSKAEVERIERRIEQVDSQIARIPPSPPGQEPPFLLNLRKQLDELKRERDELKTAAVELPETGAAFVWRPIPMEPGYPLDAEVTASLEAFNKRLQELNTKNIEPIPPVPAGQAEYVGTEQCAKCHTSAHDFWKKTHHAKAVETLTKRDKLFDGNCIGCHVTGYRKPGGSVLGKLEYTATVNGTAFTKKLQDVGCEVCHGPGSLHMKAPLDANGKAQNIQRQVGAEVCTTCHNTEHSTKFNYDNYIEFITGEGHERAK